MSDKSILFSAPMVRAILREIEQPGPGKTQTRRVIDGWCEEPPAVVYDGVITAFDENDKPYRWPRTAAVDDRLYVREAWRTHRYYDDLSPSEMGGEEPIVFEADQPSLDRRTHRLADGRLRQGMHMPRWASRITLIVTDVRVQRLQEISEADAIAEGIAVGKPMAEVPDSKGDIYHDGVSDPIDGWTRDPVEAYAQLWDNLNADRGYGWDTNPWVAAYTFRPILGNIDQVRP